MKTDRKEGMQEREWAANQHKWAVEEGLCPKSGAYTSRALDLHTEGYFSACKHILDLMGELKPEALRARVEWLTTLAAKHNDIMWRAAMAEEELRQEKENIMKRSDKNIAVRWPVPAGEVPLTGLFFLSLKEDREGILLWAIRIVGTAGPDKVITTEMALWEYPEGRSGASYPTTHRDQPSNGNIYRIQKIKDLQPLHGEFFSGPPELAEALLHYWGRHFVDNHLGGVMLREEVLFPGEEMPPALREQPPLPGSSSGADDPSAPPL